MAHTPRSTPLTKLVEHDAHNLKKIKSNYGSVDSVITPEPVLHQRNVKRVQQQKQNKEHVQSEGRG